MATRGDHKLHKAPQQSRPHPRQQQQHHHNRGDQPGSIHYQDPGSYPSGDHRERERSWSSVDPRFAHYPTSSTARPEPFGPDYGSAYQWPIYSHPQPRSLSRQGYDYSQWDYRDSYGYYNHYRRVDYQHTDGGGWPSQDQWRVNPQAERGYEPGWNETPYQEYHSYNQRQWISHVDYDQSDNTSRRRSDEFDTDALANSKTSGLSSSSYELSQYINAAEETDSSQQTYTELEAVPTMTAPLKFTLPHALVSFGPAGQLIRVNCSLGADGEQSLVEFHSLEVILGDTKEQKELRDFPGPLARSDLHKVDVITFALQRAETCLKDNSMQDPASAALLWNLLVLLCRQNGRIVGSDIAELLTRGTVSSLGSCDGSKEEEEVTSLIDLSDRPPPEEEPLDTADLLTGNPTACPADSALEALETYTQLLLRGRKKEALESAMKSGLWGHALFLASKMDNRAYTTVLNRFTGCLSPSDPLQTLFQLLSRRIPTVATSCGNDRWREWKPHLAIMLSNETEETDMHCKAINTMGDTLASRGQLHAAHICYLTARTPLGVYTNKADRLVLLGSSHNLPFAIFTQNSAIQCTEVFEYSRRLGDPTHIDPPFQVYKFLYACRLLDCGLSSQAFHYCEVVGKTLLSLRNPPMVLLRELIKLTDRLRHSDGALADTDADGNFEEPDWLTQLRTRELGTQMKHWPGFGIHGTMHVDNVTAPEENGVSSGLYPDNQYYDDQLGVHATPMIPPTDNNSREWVPPEEDPPAAGYSSVHHPSQMSSFSQPTLVPNPSPYANTEAVGWGEAQPPAPSSAQDPGLPPIQSLSQTVSHYQPSGDTPFSSSSPSQSQGQLASFGPGMMAPNANGATRGAGNFDPPTQISSMPKPKVKEPSNTQSAKSAKAGWFSGWFRSKAKESEEEAKEEGSTAASSQEPAKEPALYLGPPIVETAALAPPPASTSSSTINPFSRRAGQQSLLPPPSEVRMTPGHGALSQGP